MWKGGLGPSCILRLLLRQSSFSQAPFASWTLCTRSQRRLEVTATPAAPRRAGGPDGGAGRPHRRPRAGGAPRRRHREADVVGQLEVRATHHVAHGRHVHVRQVELLRQHVRQDLRDLVDGLLPRQTDGQRLVFEQEVRETRRRQLGPHVGVAVAGGLQHDTHRLLDALDDLDSLLRQPVLQRRLSVVAQAEEGERLATGKVAHAVVEVVLRHVHLAQQIVRHLVQDVHCLLRPHPLGGHVVGREELHGVVSPHHGVVQVGQAPRHRLLDEAAHLQLLVRLPAVVVALEGLSEERRGVGGGRPCALAPGRARSRHCCDAASFRFQHRVADPSPMKYRYCSF
eukprot:Rhum_TRINITY_DN22874_c0_g1::Rhum_TRINITY_DN22874_c0_g1_i1::g.176311::m.176311